MRSPTGRELWNLPDTKSQKHDGYTDLTSRFKRNPFPYVTGFTHFLTVYNHNRQVSLEISVFRCRHSHGQESLAIVQQISEYCLRWVLHFLP